MTYSFQPSGKWTSVHQMTLNGKRDGFTLEDFKASVLPLQQDQIEATLRVKEGF